MGFDDIRTISLPPLDDEVPFDMDGPVFLDRLDRKVTVNLTDEQLPELLSRNPQLQIIFDSLSAKCASNSELKALQNKIFKHALFTWIHIHTRTGLDWYDDVEEYLAYGRLSFGQPKFHFLNSFQNPKKPRFYGTQQFLECVEDLLENDRQIMPFSFAVVPEGDWIIKPPNQCLSKDKLQRVVQLLNGTTESDDQAELTSLIEMFDNWYASIPFELEPYKDLNKDWEENRELLKAFTLLAGHFFGNRPNRYTSESLHTGLTKKWVAEAVFAMTRHLVHEYHFLALHEKSQLNNIEKAQKDVVFALLNKQQKLLGNMQEEHGAWQYEEIWKNYLILQNGILENLKSSYHEKGSDGNSNDTGKSNLLKEHDPNFKIRLDEQLVIAYFRLLEQEHSVNGQFLPYVSHDSLNAILFRWFGIGEAPQEQVSLSYSIDRKQLVKFLVLFVKDVIHDRRKLQMKDLMTNAHHDFKPLFGASSKDSLIRNCSRDANNIQIRPQLDYKNCTYITEMMRTRKF